MSGGQAKNRALMQLMADVCGMGVVVPKGQQGKVGGEEGGGVVDRVVLGAAMLGRYADETSKGGRDSQAERLWGIMVRFSTFF